jgi:hypothetical protein
VYVAGQTHLPVRGRAVKKGWLGCHPGGLQIALEAGECHRLPVGVISRRDSLRGREVVSRDQSRSRSRNSTPSRRHGEVHPGPSRGPSSRSLTMRPSSRAGTYLLRSSATGATLVIHHKG